MNAKTSQYRLKPFFQAKSLQQLLQIGYNIVNECHPFLALKLSSTGNISRRSFHNFLLRQSWRTLLLYNSRISHFLFILWLKFTKTQRGNFEKVSSQKPHQSLNYSVFSKKISWFALTLNYCGICEINYDIFQILSIIRL